MKKYEKPNIIKVVELELENNIMTSSVAVEDTTVQTTGQEVVTYDFSDNSFTNQFWQ